MMNTLHAMVLPRRIAIGEDNMGQIGTFIRTLIGDNVVSLVSGPQVKKIVGDTVEESLAKSGLQGVWHIPEDNDIRSIQEIQEEIRISGSGIVVGIGGGRSVDIAKMPAMNLGIPCMSVPTAASHDGIASPFVSIRDDIPHSVSVDAPLGVFVDINVIKKAPARLLASGCGDLVANIIAVRDWQLGHRKTGEYYGVYSSNLAMMSANIIMENSKRFVREGPDVRMIVESLISAGIASCIAGSSRPCSGAEHLFSHALDSIAPGQGLHGEKCGIGSIMMAKLYNLDWHKIASALQDMGAPTTAKQVGLSEDDVIEALVMAQSLRPSRYTILAKTNLDQGAAKSLASETGVV